MDVNDLRIAVTLVSLVLFLALMAHTWGRGRAAEHAAAELLPFQEDDSPAAVAKNNRVEGEVA